MGKPVHNVASYNIVSYVSGRARSIAGHHYSIVVEISLGGVYSCSLRKELITGCTGFIANQHISHACINAHALVCFISPDSHCGRGLLHRLGGKPYELLHELSPLPSDDVSLSTAALAPYVYGFIDGLAGRHRRHAHHKNLQIILTYIALHLSEQINSALLGQMLHLSAERVRHMFEECTGVTLSQYILWERIRAVLRAVTEGDTFYEAAIRAGFTHHSHFSRIFKRIFGMSPTVLVNDCRLITI
jgi:AraC-like DNA-binding protein